MGTMNAPMDTPVLGFSHVQLRVGDVAASCEWYSQVLGLEQFAAADDLSYVALQHRASRMVIVISRRAHDRAVDASTEPLDHLAFAVPDGPTLQLWADHLTEVGIDHPGVVLELGKPSLQLVDPDGIEVELVAPKGT
jgi:glyoxylase I family protein